MLCFPFDFHPQLIKYSLWQEYVLQMFLKSKHSLKISILFTQALISYI